ncbi:MAG: hypothetical protein SNF33_05065 [Candidatus Algichlamydia australiensis]|nr:hypothetical protein [Chlamydiales bacterium]
MRLKRRSGIRKCNPTKELLNEKFVSRVIWECLKDGDAEGVIEVIETYLETLNKSELSNKTNLSRSTVYNTIKSRNPTLKTLAKLVHACF